MSPFCIHMYRMHFVMDILQVKKWNIAFFRCEIWQYSASEKYNLITHQYLYTESTASTSTLYHIWCCGFCVEILMCNMVVFLRCGILSDTASEEHFNTDTESDCIIQMRNMTILHISISTQNPQPAKFDNIPHLRNTTLLRISISTQNPQPLPLPSTIYDAVDSV